MRDDNTIALVIAAPAISSPPPGVYHYELMKMEYAFKLEAALQEKGEYFGPVMRATHPDSYPEPNPNPYDDKGSAADPYRGIVALCFDVLGTKDIREAYKSVYDMIADTIGTDHTLTVNEGRTSRQNVDRKNRYHPIYNPS